MAVITQIEHSSSNFQTLRLVLRNHENSEKDFSQEEVKSSINKLILIILKNVRETDPVSVDIIKKGRNLIEFYRDYLKAPTDEDFLDKAFLKIEEIRKALFNPRSKQLFQNPWIVHLGQETAVCDYSELQDFANLQAKFSEIKLEVRIHEFANEIFGWLIELPLYSKEFSEELNVSKKVDSKLSLELLQFQRYQGYLEVLRLSTELQKTRLRVRELEEANRQLEEIYIAESKVTQNLILLHKQNCENQTEELTKRLAAIEAEYKIDIEHLLKALSATEESLAETKASLTSARDELNRQKQHIEQLQTQIHYLYSQLESARKKLKNARRGCAIM